MGNLLGGIDEYAIDSNGAKASDTNRNLNSISQTRVELDESCVLLLSKEQTKLDDIFMDIHKNNGNIFGDEQVIQRYFHCINCPEFCTHLIESHVFDNIKNFRTFICNSVRVTDRKSIELLWNIFRKDSQEPIIRRFLICLYDMAFHNTLNLDQIIPSIVCLECSILKYCQNKFHSSENTTSITFDDFYCWSNDYGPFLPKIFTTFIQLQCWSNDLSPSFTPFCRSMFPKNETSSIVTESMLFPMCIYSDKLQGNWKRLYTTEVDGLSFNRLAFHIMGYNGPHCILIKVMDETHSIIGGFSDGKWSESNRYFGSNNDFIFTLHPNFSIYRSKTNSNGFYRWLNTKSYSLRHGLGFGGNGDQFRLFIPESFEECEVRSQCITYEEGKILPGLETNKFEIDILEVWACGGDEFISSGLRAQQEQRGINQQAINKARKVDKAAFFNNSFDQEFLLSSTFQHRKETQDRQNS